MTPVRYYGYPPDTSEHGGEGGVFVNGAPLPQWIELHVKGGSRRMTQFNRDSLDEAVALAKAAAEQAEQAPQPPDTITVPCTGCGADMRVVEGRIPRATLPPSGILVRRLATGQKSWYCSETCFKDHQ